MQRNTSCNPVLILLVVMVTQACNSPREKNITSAATDSDSLWAMLPFTKVDSVNPVLLPGSNSFVCPILKKQIRWEEKDVFNPAAVVKDGQVFLLYRAEDTIGKHAGTSRLGLAVSSDGFHFTKMEEPVLFPENDSLKVFEWEGGIEDPRIVEDENGTYIVTYTAYDGKIARLLLATSKDLKHWTKYGTVLKGEFKNTWSKSGAIIARQEGSKIVATKVNGKYWMYFGDTNLFMATSNDLIRWDPQLENGNLKPVLEPRPDFFDSRLVESGPYALITNEGILLLYNGMNLEEGGDPLIPAGAYCAGQALFSKNDPTLLVDRLERNFMEPEKDYELSGKVNKVCFLEGMVPFQGKWFLYYGTADSKIAVAVHE